MIDHRPAPHIGSLCTGYGGLDMAVELVLGGKLTWYAETDRHAATVCAHHWPGVPNLGDIRTITGVHSNLWTSVAHAVRALRPPVVFVENVAALRTRGLDVVHADLAALGYDTSWLCLRASDIGAPHRRDRLFLLYLDTLAQS